MITFHWAWLLAGALVIACGVLAYLDPPWLPKWARIACAVVAGIGTLGIGVLLGRRRGGPTNSLHQDSDGAAPPAEPPPKRSTRHDSPPPPPIDPVPGSDPARVDAANDWLGD